MIEMLLVLWEYFREVGAFRSIWGVKTCLNKPGWTTPDHLLCACHGICKSGACPLPTCPGPLDSVDVAAMRLMVFVGVVCAHAAGVSKADRLMHSG